MNKRILTWVPYYSIESSKDALMSSVGNNRISNIITDIGLQFWSVDFSGNLTLINNNLVDDINWFIEFSRVNNIRLHLTVVNKDESVFDWSVVKGIVKPKIRAKFISQLIEEMSKYNLDGIDLDLEGDDYTCIDVDNDRLSFKLMVDELKECLNDIDKLLNINSPPDNRYCAPKSDWWEDWNTDSIVSMVYDNANINDNTEYINQVNNAPSDNEFFIGFPVWLNEWSGESVNTHLSECIRYNCNIALWAIHHIIDENTWKDANIWSMLYKYKENC